MRKIILCYCAFLLGAILSCIWIAGETRILNYASISKPYAAVLGELKGNRTRDPKNAPIIFCFGDSNNHAPPVTLTTRRNPKDFNIYLGGLIESAIRVTLPNLNVRGVAFSGADMFHYYCMYFEAERSNPELIIVPINWRTFGVAWLGQDAFHHSELSAFVPFQTKVPCGYTDPLAMRNITATKHIGYKLQILSIYPIGIKWWVDKAIKPSIDLNGKDRNKGLPVDVKNPIDETAQRPRGFQTDLEEMRGWYTTTFTEDNRQLIALAALAAVASARETPVLFFIWPLDRELLEKFGIYDEDEFERSKQLIMKNTDKENIYFIDLSGLLEHDFFYDHVGHCTIAGRRRIAQALAPTVIDILQNKSP